MDEGQLARAMAAGELASPQQYGNSWYFDLRITGTGAAYRQALKEYVWRDPSLYLNQGFLDRCAGLPVIVEHPAKNMLDSAEYAKRNIGSIVYPYIKGDEVWGIARILDQPAARYMAEHDLSTSPAVVFAYPDVNETIEAGDGKHLLVEGKPSLLDHLAICEEGVWDKGGPPAGVDLTNTEKEAAMADEKTEHEKTEHEKTEREKTEREKELEQELEDMKSDAARRDAESGEKLDKLLEGIKVVSDRMDALEARHGRHDASAEEEEQQAAELRELAAEEETEAKEAEAAADSKERMVDAKRRYDAAHRRFDAAHERLADASARCDSATRGAYDAAHKRFDAAGKKLDAAMKGHRDDTRRDTRRDAKKRDDEDDKMPWEECAREDGESDEEYSERMDALARKHDSSYVRRDDESMAAHCDRVARGARRDAARRADRARLDRVDAIADSVDRLLNRMDRIAQLNEDRPDEELNSLADAQARADVIYQAFGDAAPRPLRGENLVGYRIRLLRGMQKHSDAWKDADLARVARSDSTTFDNAERMIYADAANAARRPTGVPDGTLRAHTARGPGGHLETTFSGRPLSWMTTFMSPGRTTTRIRPPARQ